jgi:hypothetical protein
MGGGKREGNIKWSAAQALSWIICRAPLDLRQWSAHMGSGLRNAQKDLGAAIAAGRVHAWGRAQPHGLIEKVPASQFRISGLPLVVDAHGAMTSLLPHKPYNGPKWETIEFEANEIKRVWPAPPTQAAKDWMKKEAERLKPEIGKREFMIKDCMKATGCTKRVAEKAHAALPEGLRRRQGKPPRKPG